MSSSPHPIHPAFRWVRSCGFDARAPTETVEGDKVVIRQWIRTPDIGWDQYITDRPLADWARSASLPALIAASLQVAA